MHVSDLHHVTIRCDAGDLPALETFYVEVLGLKTGERPPLRQPGRWLYGTQAQAILHLNAIGRPASPGASPLDHVAFATRGLLRTRERLAGLGLAYTEAKVPGAPLHQLFLTDPCGLKVELTFDLGLEEGAA